MTLLVLSARMLRYRVAAMLWLFLLLAAARDGGLAHVSWPRLAGAAAALAAAYVAATTVNDVADEAVDRINHPRDRGRPLVTGDATRRQLVVLHVVAGAAALVLASPLGAVAVAVVGASLVLAWAYSLRPLRLSYRTLWTPAALAAAYVLVPYALGLVAVGRSPGGRDAVFAAALVALFVARIVLKDFRDREGDRRYGKRTLLLRHGKRVTCRVSLAALLSGDVLLVLALRPELPQAMLVQLFVAGAAYALASLACAYEPHREQVAIGTGARVGNGLLIWVLGGLVLAGGGATDAERLAFDAAVTALFAVGFAALVACPDEAVVGYKG